jgi:O-methyltransferase
VTRPPEELYLDLLKKCLTRVIFPEKYDPVRPKIGGIKARAYRPLQIALGRAGLELCRPVAFDEERRREGLDWPADAETMVGVRRLDNLQYCIKDVVQREVPGDLIEAGVWRGGATIFMRAALEAYGDGDRVVWAADSFEGLPQPDETLYPVDRGSDFWRSQRLAVSVGEVKQNFQRYGLLDDRIRFLVGWFRETLPTAPIGRLSILRLDGDMYESTFVALRSLYPKLSPGGYVIVDDYNAIQECRAAVDDFRARSGIGEPLREIDRQAVFWHRRT